MVAKVFIERQERFLLSEEWVCRKTLACTIGKDRSVPVMHRIGIICQIQAT